MEKVVLTIDSDGDLISDNGVTLNTVLEEKIAEMNAGGQMAVRSVNLDKLAALEKAGFTAAEIISLRDQGILN